jgi:hypothetical protein
MKMAYALFWTAITFVVIIWITSVIIVVAPRGKLPRLCVIEKERSYEGLSDVAVRHMSRVRS